MHMNRTLRSYLPHICGGLLLCALTVFLLRLLPAPPAPEESGSSAAAVSSAAATSESSDPAAASSPTLSEEDPRSPVVAYLQQLPRYTEGTKSCLSVEEAGAILTLEATFGGSTGVSDVFSLADGVKKIPVRRPGDDGGYTTVLTEQTLPIPQLTLYGGILLQTTAEGRQILDKTGAPTVNVTDYELPYLRSSLQEQYPLFRKDGKYYYYADGSLQETTAVRNLGIYFDYNSAYYSPAVPYYPFKDAATGFFGYKKGNEIVIDPNTDKLNSTAGQDKLKYRFYRGFFFDSEGLAAVQTKQNGRIVFIDPTGTVVIDPDLFSYSYTTGTKALDLFLLPDTFGEESMGFLYFDHGYTRVRRQVVDRTNFSSILEDYDTLIDTKGDYCELPGGYTLVGYRDGVVLLQKGERYGFFKPGTGWITEPLYTYATPFSGGLGVIGTEEGKVGAMDAKGAFVIPQIFDYISPVSEDRVLCYSADSGWVLLRLAGGAA